jgi:hypothetical protein
MKMTRILLAILAVAVFTSPLAAVTATFQENHNGYTGTEDTYLSKSHLENNYGGSDWAIVQDVHHTGRFKEAMIKFQDIFGAGLGQIPAGQTIQSATLSLFVYQDIINNPNVQKGLIAYPMLVSANFGNSDGPAAVGEVDRWQRAQAQTDWGPPANQGPVLGTDWTDTMSAQVGFTGANVIELWLDLDITAILTAWYDGSMDNHGLLIQGLTGNTAAYIYTENDLFAATPGWSDNVPILTVEYVPEPMTMSLLALGCVALIRRRRA